MGRWLSDQRRTYRAGAMSEVRAAELEGLGIFWDTTDAAFDANLAAPRAYYEVHGTPRRCIDRVRARQGGRERHASRTSSKRLRGPPRPVVSWPGLRNRSSRDVGRPRSR
ncbi:MULTISPECIES: helicase associated domain-containing protein [unclassified Streptomyces]|uniref:helicase associated domain-containing protein n=1 Tax=unclassified Streptomyces TaxID=2593676 RepID=UPI003449B0EE